jgi:hypothetical protein
MQFEQYGGYAKLGYEMTSHWNLRGQWKSQRSNDKGQTDLFYSSW